MSANPPLFDDDDLPSWLQEAGITPNKPDNEPVTPPSDMAQFNAASQPTEDEEEFDWFAATFGSGSPSDVQATTPEPLIDLTANPAEDEWWSKGEAQFADEQGQTPSMPGWQLDAPQAKKKGNTTPLPWFAENAATPEAVEPESPLTERMDDLFASIAPPATTPPSMPNIPTAPKPGTGQLKPATGQLKPGTGQLAHDAPTINTAAESGRRTVRKITSSLASPPPSTPSVPPVPSSEKQPVMPVNDKNNPNEPDSNEIEDWFSSLNLPGTDDAALPDTFATGPAPSPEEYMPDWMLKGELPQHDSASGDSISDADSEALAELFAEPPPAPEPEPAAADDAPAWLTEMGFDDAPAAPVLPPDAAPQKPADMDWLNNLETNVSETSLQAGQMRPMDLGWLTESSQLPKPSVPSVVPSSLNEGELNIDDLLAGGSPDIDALLNLSEAATTTPPHQTEQLPSFDSDPSLQMPAPRAAETTSMRPPDASRSSRPQDDLDALFADDVIDEDIFNKRQVAGTAMFQGVGLQGEDTSGTADNMPPAMTASGMTALFNRSEEFKGAATPETPKPAPAEEPFRDFSNVGETVPEWVTEMRPSDLPIALNVGDQVVKLKEDPLSKLPDQIRALRDRAKEFRVVETKQTAPLEGPLAGITGAITPMAPQSTALPSSSLPRRPAAITDTFSDRIKILQNFLNLEQEVLERQKLEEEQREAIEKGEAADAIKTGPRIRATLKIDRLIVTLLLIAVILFPFLTNATNIMPSLDNVAASLNASDPRFQRLTQTLASLNRDQTVLVAFEYAPSGAAEMDEIARVVLSDLAVRGVRPVIVSTNPAGVMHAYALLDKLGRDLAWRTLTKRSGDLVNRQDYYVLRYLPGGIVGLRTLVNALEAPTVDPVFQTDFEGQATNLTDEALTGLRAAPTFVLADSADDVRNWSEQFRAAGADHAHPIVMFSSAGASAIAQSYVASNDQIVSLLVGVRDAAIYSRLNALEGDAQASRRAEQRWQSLQLGLFITSFVILFGMVLNTMRGIVRRRTTR